MIKKIMIIAAMIVTITLVTIIYGYKENKQSYNRFNKTGYIITKDAENYSTKYYFDADTKYKENYADQVTFEDVNDSKIKVDNKNFIHYTDGSIGALDKSVILNLEEISAPIIPYYNMTKQIELEYANGKYIIKNLNKQLELSNFIMKISDNKYMIVSNDMTLQLDDDREEKLNGYYEITYIDENVIRIENQEKTYQTIASNTNIKINNIKIDLNQKSVFLNEERKLEFSQMVINSDDNIELTELPEIENEVSEEEQENENQENEEQGNEEQEINIDYGKIEEGTTGNNKNATISNGNINGTTTTEEETAKNIELPVFSVTDLKTTTNIIDAQIQITDNDGLLTGDTTTKIIENNTGKVVYMTTTPNGIYDIPISMDNLKPDTNYTLISQAIYKKDEIEYKNDFINKIFRTESLGIDVEKDYFTTDTLSLNLKISEYSNIQSFKVTLTDEAGNLIKTQDIDSTIITDNKYNIIFDELNPNTDYKITLSNFVYEGLIMSANYNQTYQYKTLKQRPTINGTIYSINKKESMFTLALGNLKDPDNGIESYRYEIYNATQITQDNVAEPVATIEKSKLTSIDLKVDEKTLYRGTPYVFKVVCEFNDNEKIIEYETEYSNTFKLDGVEYPSVSFEKTNITFERIEGKILIDDPGRTLSLDSTNVMTVVYKNSIGITESFEYYGNLIIPFDKNNLRSGETYTISVYGTIDLQDGNGPTYCLIGTAVVNTPNTRPLKATMSKMLDVNKTFKINATLDSLEENDDLEATTLTGLTFNLYAGGDTSAPLVKTVKKIDTDIQPYSSNLKKSYYDTTFEITPEFFGLKSSDLKNGNYTIEITNGYDYTRYQNPIDINNNIISLQANGVVPNLPQNVDDCIDVNAIRNSNISNGRDDLNAETIVGYKMRANYDNSSRLLKYIKYYVYDAETNELLTPDGIISNANFDGTINFETIYLEDGIVDDDLDKGIRRGKTYYFSYEAYLDTDKDNIAETIYPQVIDSTVKLKSETLQPNKQEPTIYLYPSSTTDNQAIWKYNIYDVDNAIKNQTFSAYINNVLKDTQPIEINKDSYETLTFNNLQKGVFTISYDQTLTKGNVQTKQLVEQNFEGIYDLPRITYHLNKDVNKLTITLNNYEGNKSIYDRITALKVKFITSDSTKVLDFVPLQQDRAIIDLTEVSELINKEITVNVSAYYDSGISGYETTGLQAIQYTDITENKYISISDDLIYDNDNASESIYETTFDQKNINIQSKVYNTSVSLPILLTKNGVKYNYNTVTLKKIHEKVIECDDTPTFLFDKIIPGVSLLNKQGQLDILTTLAEAKFRIKVNGTNASYISQNKIYIELYKVDETGLGSTYIKTLETNVEELKNQYIISDLDPKTNYYIKICANLVTDNGIEYAQLYDVDYNSAGKLYYFKTLSEVGIQMKNVKMNFKSYQNKELEFTYNMDNISGIKKIEYNIYKYNKENGEYILNETPVDFGIEDDLIPTATMTKKILCNPGSNCEYDTKYKIEIIPYAEVDDELIRLDDEFSYDYTTPTPTRPFIWTKGTYDDTNLNFKISVVDPYKMIVEGKYKVNIYEIINDTKTDITPESVKNTEFSILSLNSTITIPDANISSRKEYEIEVITYLDEQNQIQPTEKYTKTYRINSQNFEGIYLGDVYTTKNNTNPQKMDIVFYNSNRLYEIDEVRYSIYNSNGYAKDNRINFNIQPTDNYYIMTLPELFEYEDVYYIEMQFLKNNKVMKQLSIEYAYK